MPLRQHPVQPLAANVRSKALAGSDLSGEIAPWRTISGRWLFGIRPSSAKMNVSVLSGTLSPPGSPYPFACVMTSLRVDCPEENARVRCKDRHRDRWSHLLTDARV